MVLFFVILYYKNYKLSVFFFFLVLIGYVIAITPTWTSSNNAVNSYFDVKLMVNINEVKELRVMVLKDSPNASTSRDAFKKKL